VIARSTLTLTSGTVFSGRSYLVRTSRSASLPASLRFKTRRTGRPRQDSTGRRHPGRRRRRRAQLATTAHGDPTRMRTIRHSDSKFACIYVRCAITATIGLEIDVRAAEVDVRARGGRHGDGSMSSRMDAVTDRAGTAVARRRGTWPGWVELAPTRMGRSPVVKSYRRHQMSTALGGKLSILSKGMAPYYKNVLFPDKEKYTYIQIISNILVLCNTR
jgi:hypothetical protein